MAEGNGSNERSLSNHRELPGQREVRIGESIETGSGFHSIEHRRRSSQERHTRILAIPVARERFSSGIGNADFAKHRSGILQHTRRQLDSSRDFRIAEDDGRNSAEISRVLATSHLSLATRKVSRA